MKKFCKDLKKHAAKKINCEKKKKRKIQLINEEKKLHREQKVCYICKKEFNADNKKYYY